MSDRHVPQPGEFLLYETEDGRTRVECRFAEDTIWLSQAMMAELFRTSPQNIALHPEALYSQGEITEEATCRSHLQVRSDGERQADAHTARQHEQLAAHPRPLPAAEGVDFHVRALEDAAKALPTPDKKRQ